jgi:hypothetical protein
MDGSIAQFIADAERHGFRFVASGAVPKFLSLSTKESGLLVLSKFPLNVISTLQLRPKATAGTIYLRVRPSAFEFINVVVTQLSAGRAVRTAKLEQLTAFTAKLVTDAFSLFILGAVGGSADTEFRDGVAKLRVQRRTVVDLAIGGATVAGRKVHPVAFYLKPAQDYVVEKATGKMKTFEGQLATDAEIEIAAPFVNLLNEE